MQDKALAPSVVLDTNIVLDWLVFNDSRCGALVQSIVSGQLRWFASSAMRNELECVLDRGVGRDRKPDRAAIAAAWEQWAVSVAPSDEPTLRGLRCSDVDDQKFIDLALQVRAKALVSRDRAVLKLARRAGAHGLAIVLPTYWKPERAAEVPPQAPVINVARLDANA